mmetsp:Transcript_1709/g.2641  ORF Transcript_1709/g.2641 Transcript_1709/m.2641 type:complete len:527 (+) Transcript_1709:131-1711(+)|eukprot:CAMPEP_0184650062 /NCGR_PEP_ID=MMETSP0308-20130426/7552_1 /TAXON_ID=38269 /ORGANISM="Gloeochaete witrockiana, Strain SAG 46.84" /LENGTH=526 /DNA_ID=CAMNT_0027083303 /DNA_START=41 /DNA_END=1621 /DNA_ORIENTATION=+
MREIISIQTGGYSNFVGAHFWNIQDEYNGFSASEINQEVLFRAGENRQGQPTQTPRLVLFDIPENLGSLHHEGDLYASGEGLSSRIPWEGNVLKVEAEKVEKNRYLQSLEQPEGNAAEEPKIWEVESFVNCWSDFLKVQLHPRTIYTLPSATYMHSGGSSPMDVFTAGHEIMANLEQQDAILDRLRYFAEECDGLQGFHIVTDSHTGYGALATDLLQAIADEYTGAPAVVFAVSPHVDRSFCNEPWFLRRKLNSILSLASLSNTSALYVPLGNGDDDWSLSKRFPGLQRLNVSSVFQTSAILGACLNTCTLSYRSAVPELSLSELVYGLRVRSTDRVAALSIALPFPAVQSDYEADARQSSSQLRHDLGSSQLRNATYMTNLTPSLTQESLCTVTSEHVVLNGAQCWNRTEDVASVLDTFLANTPCYKRSRSIFSQPMPVPIPFPQFFSLAKTASEVGETATLGHLQVTPALHGFLEKARQDFAKLEKEHRAILQADEQLGFGTDENIGCRNYLVELAEEYETRQS